MGAPFRSRRRCECFHRTAFFCLSQRNRPAIVPTVPLRSLGERFGKVKAMRINVAQPFKGRQYAGEIILTAVRWYLRYPLAYEHVSELLTERGLSVDASCIWRWVQAYAAELKKRCRRHLKATNKSYRVDETYIKVKGQEKYLYRAVDSTGQTIDFLLTAKRDAAAAKRSFAGYFAFLAIPYHGSSMSIRIQLTPLLSER